MTRYSSDASGGRWFFFLLWKRVGEEGRRLRLPSRLPEQFAYDLDSTSTFTFSFGCNGWFWASLLASMRSDDVYLPSEKRKRPRGKSLEWPCGQGPSLRFGTRGAPLRLGIRHKCTTRAHLHLSWAPARDSSAALWRLIVLILVLPPNLPTVRACPSSPGFSVYNTTQLERRRRF